MNPVSLLTGEGASVVPAVSSQTTLRRSVCCTLNEQYQWWESARRAGRVPECRMRKQRGRKKGHASHGMMDGAQHPIAGLSTCVPDATVTTKGEFVAVNQGIALEVA